jgi:hypothetical protein
VPTPIPPGPRGDFELVKTHQFKGTTAVNTNARWVFILRNDEGRSWPCTLPNPSDSSKCTTNTNGNDHTLHYEGLPADTYVLCERAFENWRPQYSNQPAGSTPDGRCLTFTLGAGQSLTSADGSEIRVNNFCPTPPGRSRNRRR